ncbi:MAG: acyl-CoA dehydrogenase domain-containing protein, partial [Pseudomonadota bacterium]|nr:acyl-CoA dehydrogenase domain-containing protein [Pseudomonadota bacterium]
ARYAIEDNLHKAHEALTDVLQKDTYPMGGFFGNVVRLKLKVLSGTFGHRHKKPSGKLQDEITKSLSENGDTLKLLTEEVYFPKESGGPIADLKKAFEGTLAAQDLEKKLNEADRQSGLKQNEQFADRVANAVTLGVLTQDEAKELLEVYEARMRVVNVDEVKKEDYRPAVNPS